MKKAKFLLTAITVLAIAGGAFSFKAKSAFTHQIFTGPAVDNCPTKTFAITTATGTTRVFYTTNAATPNSCSLAFTTVDL